MHKPSALFGSLLLFDTKEPFLSLLSAPLLRFSPAVLPVKAARRRNGAPHSGLGPSLSNTSRDLVSSLKCHPPPFKTPRSLPFPSGPSAQPRDPGHFLLLPQAGDSPVLFNPPSTSFAMKDQQCSASPFYPKLMPQRKKLSTVPL